MGPPILASRNSGKFSAASREHRLGNFLPKFPAASHNYDGSSPGLRYNHSHENTQEQS